jgi:hypothetical protein
LTPLHDSPLIRSAYLLAKNFGWTLPQINALTVAQVELLVTMLEKDLEPS